MMTRIKLEKKIDAASQEISNHLRKCFRDKSIFVINLIGSPGAGKTSLLESLAPRLIGKAAVIEGDLQTDEDKKRIERSGLHAYQINTLGACHLDAKMVQRAVEEFPLDGVRFLFIENVGNLVCPTSFDIGEDIKIAVVSIVEGDDKPAKYPVAFRVSSAMILTKLDLLPYIDCSVQRMEKDALAANPGLKIFKTSIKTNEGMEEFLDWLEESASSR